MANKKQKIRKVSADVKVWIDEPCYVRNKRRQGHPYEEGSVSSISFSGLKDGTIRAQYRVMLKRSSPPKNQYQTWETPLYIYVGNEDIEPIK